jgi:hypothetical protein
VKPRRPPIEKPTQREVLSAKIDRTSSALESTAYEELVAARKAETERARCGKPRLHGDSWTTHPLRRFDAIDRALARHGFTITRRS